MDFTLFKYAVAAQFARMSQYPLFRTSAHVHDVVEDQGPSVRIKDHGMWETYLAAFPEGSNLIFRERTEHDCTCCRHFIRDIGNVVAIIEGQVVSIWDIDIKDPAYKAVAAAMSKHVKRCPIVDAFLYGASSVGTDRSLADTLKGVISFSHLFVNLPPGCVVPKEDVATRLGKFRTTHDIFIRGLETITDDAIDTVLDLIAQNALYRGAEHKPAVQAFAKVKQEYKTQVSTGDQSAQAFTWVKSMSIGEAIARIRNTAIGTLLVDLSDDEAWQGKHRDTWLEEAVKSFEAKVAPANYKRPTALVTKAMIENARKAIVELGLESALSRRYAVLTDITVTNTLYSNRDARRRMGANVFDDLADKVTASPKSFDKAEDVPIERFIREIMPRAATIELMVENRHESNLVSLIAPVDPTAKRLFKWDNAFSWSYNGEMADSIKERVKRAGGNVTGDLCCRLAWEYKDDLDFHMIEPKGTEIAYWQYRRQNSPCGGQLDLDANGADGNRDDPAENIVYADRRRMEEGIYSLFVYNYNRRSDGAGFEVEVEFDGQTHRMAYDRVLRTNDRVDVARIRYEKGHFEIVESLPSTQATREVWGLTTQTFRPVNVVMLSPNYWDGQGVGNKHWFFMIDGCLNDAKARGFFNEFLLQELDVHRKVIEMVGAKMRTDEADQQLSGLGFSSTQRNSILCRVTGAFSRVINLVF